MPTLLRIDHHVRTIGEVSEDVISFLRAELEEETEADRDYYVDHGTIEMLAGKGAPVELLQLLIGALGTDDGMDIAWREGDPLETVPRGPFR